MYYLSLSDSFMYSRFVVSRLYSEREILSTSRRREEDPACIRCSARSRTLVPRSPKIEDRGFFKALRGRRQPKLWLRRSKIGTVLRSSVPKIEEEGFFRRREIGHARRGAPAASRRAASECIYISIHMYIYIYIYMHVCIYNASPPRAPPRAPRGTAPAPRPESAPA